MKSISELAEEVKARKEAEYEKLWRETRDLVRQAEAEVMKLKPLFMTLSETCDTLIHMFYSSTVIEETKTRLEKFFEDPTKGNLIPHFYKCEGRFFFDHVFHIRSKKKVAYRGWIDQLSPVVSIYTGSKFEIRYTFGELYHDDGALFKTGPIYIELMSQAISELPKLIDEMKEFIESL